MEEEGIAKMVTPIVNFAYQKGELKLEFGLATNSNGQKLRDFKVMLEMAIKDVEKEIMKINLENTGRVL